MGIFNKFKRKNEELSEEEKEKFTNLMSSDDDKSQKEEQQDQQLDIFSYVKSLKSIHEINKIRNMLDEQEKQITGVRPGNENHEDIRDNQYVDMYEEQSSEENKENNIEKDNNSENSFFEVEEISSYKDIEEPQSKPQKEEEITQKYVEEDNDRMIEDFNSYYEKLKEIFGEENIFTNKSQDHNLDVLDNKQIISFGIRQKSSFGDENSSTQDENSWFVNGIKQLETLKEFKMIRSDKGIKDLLLDKGDYAVMISFKATNLLASIDEFDFEL